MDNIKNNPNKLFVYGTLMPGEVNEHWLKDIGGVFSKASVKGVLIPDGWGAAIGFPALIISERGQVVNGYVFESNDLPKHWQALDDFEGEGYERILTNVVMEDGLMDNAWFYALSVDENTAEALISNYTKFS